MARTNKAGVEIAWPLHSTLAEVIAEASTAEAERGEKDRVAGKAPKPAAMTL